MPIIQRLGWQIKDRFTGQEHRIGEAFVDGEFRSLVDMLEVAQDEAMIKGALRQFTRS